MPTIKYEGPGLDTIKKGIHTSIILTKDELNSMLPGATRTTSTRDATDAALLGTIFPWNQTERRYSLLQGDILIAGTPTVIRFDMSTGIISIKTGLRYGEKIKFIFDAEIDDENFIKPEDFEYKVTYVDYDLLISTSPIGKDLSKLTLEQLKTRHQQSLDGMVVEYHKSLQAGKISTFFFNRVRDQIRNRQSVPPKPDPTIKGFKHVPLTFLETEQEFELLREFIAEANGAEIWLEREMGQLVRAMVTGYYIMVMSLMRRFIEIPPQEVAGDTRNGILKEFQIPTTYKYNGVVNVMDNRVFKLVTTPHEKREFTRHVGRWLVRGHWRTYETGKKIWIDQYEKGKPDAEASDRIYKNLV